MDPLSISAAVVGLLTAATQISQTIGNVIQRSRKAPKECRELQLEVNTIHGILEQLQLFVLGISKPSRSRTSLILVDQVVVTLSACVTTFSELDVFADTLASDARLGLLDRLRWTTKADSLSDILGRLQAHKVSLSLMLTILTWLVAPFTLQHFKLTSVIVFVCQTTIEAENSVDRLCKVVEETLAKYVVLAERLNSLEPRVELPEHRARSLKFTETKTPETGVNMASPGQSVTVSATDPVADTTPIQIPYELRTDNHASSTSDVQTASEPPGLSLEAQGMAHRTEEVSSLAIQSNPVHFVFEEMLLQSRAYRRAPDSGDEKLSILSSAGRTASWSMLSGLSLTEVSMIGVLALPIYATDISNGDHYEFGDPVSELTKTMTALNPSFVKEQSESNTKRKGFSKLTQKLWPKAANPTPLLQTPPRNTAVIMGVPLSESMRYANAAITRSREGGEPLSAHIPLLVASCCRFLREKGRAEPDLFVLPGSPNRVHALENAFSEAPKYGRGLSWTGYTVHDCANLLLRYLKSLPGPVIPYDFYDRFTVVMRDPSFRQSQISDPDSVAQYLRTMVAKMPELNRVLLIYLIVLISVFTFKAKFNRLNVDRLVPRFHPSLLSRSSQEMDATEHSLAQDTITLLAIYALLDCTKGHPGFLTDDVMLVGCNAELDGLSTNVNLPNIRISIPPLALAAKAGSLSYALFLVNLNAKIDEEDADGCTPLVLAGISGHLNVASFLIDQGANVNHRDNKQMTPLLWAALKSTLEMVKFLVQRGAEYTGVKNVFGETALSLAIRGGDLATVQYLEGLLGSDSDPGA